MGSLETAGKAQWRTEVTAAVDWMEAETEVPLEKSGAGIRVGEGQLLLGASAGVTTVSPGASRHMLAAEAVVEAEVRKEGDVKEPAGSSWQVVAS